MNQILDALLHSQNDAFGFFDQVFLFGSALRTDAPNDIDILLVYVTVRPQQVNLEKERTKQILACKVPDYDLHLTVLSKSELQQTNFLMKVPHRKIKG